MKENNVTRRKELVCSLLKQLKDTCLHMNELAEEMGGSADFYLQKIFSESNDEIMTLAEEYNGNIRQAQEITQQMTRRMNDWVAFTTDEKNLSGVLFPLRYYLEKKEVKKFINRSREQISEKVIRNRFVKEKLDGMEEKLRSRAVLKIETEDKFNAFNELTAVKKEILGHLCYLMPTIPDLCPLKFSVNDIDYLIQKLSPVG
ncbi:MAG: hypothetical protein KBA53_13930 [Thermoclostridium sp.]|nr:hypothetical protein [Thermoclostridium sp.]